MVRAPTPWQADLPKLNCRANGTFNVVKLDANGNVATSGIQQPTDLGYDQKTDLLAATALAAPAGAVLALITAEGADVRWRADQMDPTAAVGNPLASGATLAYSRDLAAIKFIQQAASAKLNINFFK
jgi:hypothetical protein